MLIQRVPEKANLSHEPAGACRVLAVRGEPFGNHDTTVVGGMDSDSWGLGYRGQPLQSVGDHPGRGTTMPGIGRAIKGGRVSQERVGPLHERGAEFMEGKALANHVPPLHSWDRIPVHFLGSITTGCLAPWALQKCARHWRWALWRLQLYRSQTLNTSTARPC